MPEIQPKGEPQKEDLNIRLNKLSEETQSAIAGFSSFFLEPDVYQTYKNHPDKINAFKEQLEELGFGSEAIEVTFELVGFTKVNEQDNNK